jgi:outer membrane receptor protein involved in Fe transport
MKRNSILCSILLFSSVISAQPAKPVDDAAISPGIVRGFIKDSTTLGAIEYATVGIYRIEDSKLVNGVVTTPDGAFTIRDIPEGEYYIEAGFLGYDKKKVPVSLSAQRRSVDLGIVSLNPDVTQIDEVEVVAQRNRVEYKVDKKVVNVAQDLTSSGGSLVNVLENTPSVQVDVEGNVSLRGSGNFQLLIDGKPSPVQGSEGLQQIPASAVQSLEIITNPSAKYDPDGNAGIINVVMKKQKNSGIGGVINVSAGTRHKYTGDFLFNIKRNKLNYFFGAEYADRHFINRGFSERRAYSGDSATYIQGNARGIITRKSMNLKSGFDYAFTENASLSLSAAVGSRDLTRDFVTNNHWYTTPATKDSFFREENHATDNDQFFNINLDFLKRYNETDHRLDASIYYSGQKEIEKEEDYVRKTNGIFEPAGNESSRTRSRQEHPEKELRFELDYTRPMGAVKLETGLQSRWDYENADFIYEDYQPFGSEWIQNDTLTNAIKYLDALQSVYAMVSGPLGRFDYQAGLRAEYDNRTLEQVTSSTSYTYEKIHFFPSVFLTRKLNDAHQIQFNYSRRIQRPRGNQLNPFVDFRGSNNIYYGNPALKPEFTNAFELNYQYRFEQGSISLETYYRTTHDKITSINELDTLYGRPVFAFTVTNADRDHALGMELMANIDLAKWWQLNLTGNIFRYQLEGKADGEQISTVSTSWQTNFNTLFKIKGDIRFQVNGIYNGPSTSLQGERDGFFITNLAIRKEMLDKKLTVSLNARDIFSTGKFAFTSEGDSFYTYNRFRRESPVVTLNLSYRINNYKAAARRDGNGGAESGGMDEIM